MNRSRSGDGRSSARPPPRPYAPGPCLASRTSISLASVPLFSLCSKKELQAVAKATDEMELPAGRVLCEQGSTGREAFIILDGTAEVTRNDQQVAIAGPGTCVGELALLDHGPRTATVTAQTDSASSCWASGSSPRSSTTCRPSLASCCGRSPAPSATSTPRPTADRCRVRAPTTARSTFAA